MANLLGLGRLEGDLDGNREIFIVLGSCLSTIKMLH